MTMASNSGRGICSVNSTVKKLIRVRACRTKRRAWAIIRCGMASSHCTRGRHRVMWRSACSSSWRGYGTGMDTVAPWFGPLRERNGGSARALMPCSVRRSMASPAGPDVAVAMFSTVSLAYVVTLLGGSASGKMKEQQHTDDDRGGSTDKSQDEQNLRSGSDVCERQPARNHQHGSHQSVMPVHRHRVAPFLLASRASLTGSERGKGQMPPYVTLGLAARKALPGSR